MNIRTATRTAAAAAALILAGVSLAACASASPSVADGAYGELDRGYMIVQDGQFYDIYPVNRDDKSAPTDSTKTIEALTNDKIDVSGAKVDDLIDGGEYDYEVLRIGELSDDGEGIVWNGDVKNIETLELDTPAEGLFTIDGDLVYAGIDSDEYKNAG